MSSSRHSSSSPLDEPTAPGGLNTPDPNAAGPDAADEMPSLRATSTVTGYDGTVLATISRHTEYPTHNGEAPLAVVDVAGDIDADTAPLLYAVLAHAIRRNERVCCDLGRAVFLGAAAVNTILAAFTDADEACCVLTVRGVHGFGTRVFQITGLDEFLASRA